MELSLLHSVIWKHSRSPEVLNIIKTFGKNVKAGRGDYAAEMASGGTMYCYLYAAAEILKPKQIVEMGADCGASTASLSMGSPKKCKIYSAETRQGAWEYVGTDKKVIKCHMDYMQIKDWPSQLDLKKTDMWFIDGNHGEDHVKQQMALYEPYFKKGCLILFDDTKMYKGAFQGKKWEWEEVPEVHGNSFIIARP